MEPIPCTTVQKITGPIIILMSEMKPSPSGLRATPEVRKVMADQDAGGDGE
jgi:hypothetical protein